MGNGRHSRLQTIPLERSTDILLISSPLFVSGCVAASRGCSQLFRWLLPRPGTPSGSGAALLPGQEAESRRDGEDSPRGQHVTGLARSAYNAACITFRTKSQSTVVQSISSNSIAGPGVASGQRTCPQT